MRSYTRKGKQQNEEIIYEIGGKILQTTHMIKGIQNFRRNLTNIKTRNILFKNGQDLNRYFLT